MIIANSPAAMELDESVLLDYERLRSDALSKPETISGGALGLALFIRQGMLAWMEVHRRCLPAPPKPNKPWEAPVFAYQVSSEMIKVMANITLFNLDEAQL